MTAWDNQIFAQEATVGEDGRTVRYSVQYGAKAKRFFSDEPFFVRYDRDVSGVPRSVLMIPLLANLCPVAWIAGADVFVDCLDKKFYHSLLAAKDSFAAMYPRLKFAGHIHAGELVDADPAGETARSAAFFSGGVDSLGTFLRRREENPYLITVWGADITFAQKEMWDEVSRYNENFGRSNGLDCLMIHSSMRSFLNEEYISFHCERITHGWWSGVQHGLGLSGLCAPLAYALGIRRLYVPSALPPTLSASMPDGSNTMICNQVQWAGTRVQLDGEEQTRQDKVAAIAEWMRGSQASPTVRVCWTNKSYGNCGRCEKCLRTIAALMAEGVDPSRAGFPVGRQTYEDIRKQLPVWLSSNNPLKIEYWKEIADRSLTNDRLLRPEDRSLLEWLRALDYRVRRQRRNMSQALLDWLPHPVFLSIKKAVKPAAKRKMN